MTFDPQACFSPAEPMCEQSPQSRRLWVRGKVECEGIEMVLGGIRRVQRCLAANQTVLMPRSRGFLSSPALRLAISVQASGT
ncbi:hypothetical protein SRHO_G00158130 [Serrasalmus rhombeus]